MAESPEFTLFTYEEVLHISENTHLFLPASPVTKKVDLSARVLTLQASSVPTGLHTEGCLESSSIFIFILSNMNNDSIKFLIISNQSENKTMPFAEVERDKKISYFCASILVCTHTHTHTQSIIVTRKSTLLMFQID